MPDVQTFVLPARAYVLSMRDQQLPMRRAALEDAAAHYLEQRVAGGYGEHLGLVALIGEALQVVEDLGAFASSLTTALPGMPFFAALTTYSTRDVNNFYAQIKKRTPDYFLQLLGLRLGDNRLEDVFVFQPSLTAKDLELLDQAHAATAALVARHLAAIADDWAGLRRFHHAFKHGFLVANPDDVTLVDDRVSDVPGIVVWQRNQPSARGVGAITPPYDAFADRIAELGRLALDVLQHLIDIRTEVVNLVELGPDGTVTPRRSQRYPWRLWWFDNKDLSVETRQAITDRFKISFANDGVGSPEP